MSTEGLKLSVYFGERDRVHGGLLSGALMDRLAAAEVLASALLRGIEGFGIKHQLRTTRLLTLSEDLPLMAVAVDYAPRVTRLLPEIQAIVGGGLITLERIALPAASSPTTSSATARRTPRSRSTAGAGRRAAPGRWWPRRWMR